MQLCNYNISGAWVCVSDDQDFHFGRVFLGKFHIVTSLINDGGTGAGRS